MKYSFYILILLAFFACEKTVIRKPISGSNTRNFMEVSIALHKGINKLEEDVFKKMMQKDSLHTYKKSNAGFWYYVSKQIDTTSNYPKHGDEVVINYEIKSLDNKVIYKKEELGTKGQGNPADRLYKVDGEDFIKGIQEGVKLMKLGETAVFLFPSDQVFGSKGFQDRIAPNQALIIEVYLKKIINKTK